MLVLSMYMFKERPPSVGNYVYIGHYIYHVVYILVTPNLTLQIRRLLGAFMSPSLTIANLTITRQIRWPTPYDLQYAKSRRDGG